LTDNHTHSLEQLAKASTLALISMFIIIVTVVTQGAIVDSDLRGSVKGLLFVNDGFFQAVGVISFGKLGEQSADFMDR
jgi:sodium-coupled neutral amino acid transporter 11